MHPLKFFVIKGQIVAHRVKEVDDEYLAFDVGERQVSPKWFTNSKSAIR